MSITLAASAAALFGIGTWLLLQRRLSRLIIGLGLISHGANLLLIISGRDGFPAFVQGAPDRPGDYVDPLPQAMLLTAIVISFGVTAFLLGMAWRSFVLTGDDLVEDDLEDARVARERAENEEVADTRAAEAAQALAESGAAPGEATDRAFGEGEASP
ncbi:MAG: NADH-quinone oxidoreductase subunit K [Microthrixaceae bacterium]